MSNRTLLSKLGKDASANVLAIAAASFIPMIAVIGGGVDASRLYLVQSRLQQACDAGALAARKELGGGSITGSIPSSVEDAAHTFFDINFADGMYGTSNRNFTLTSAGDARLDGAADVDVPMTLMRVFNYTTVNIAVDCSADLNLPNIDIALVLDMSGSMRGSRIADLKDAVFAFYDQVMAVKPDDARIRIGIVPYNGAVNVGAMLMAENPSFIADQWTYQSRVANFHWTLLDESEQRELSDGRQLLPVNAGLLGSTNSDHYRWSSNPNHGSAGHDACNLMDGTYMVGEERWVVTNDDYYSNYHSGGSGGWRGACEARVRKYQAYGNKFRDYTYRSMAFDTSRFKLGESVGTATGSEGATVWSTWNGCIEERKTNPTHDYSPIPSDALDLDINMTPNPADPDTQWKPMWPDITYQRSGPRDQRTSSDRSTRGFNCPVPSVRLAEYPLSGGSRNAQFASIINSLDPGGGTMHDIGVLWGARILSPRGIFAADNATAPNGNSIARHLIFMTDGEMGASPGNTTSYGNYDLDGRFAGFHARGSWRESELAVIHNGRLDSLCARVKNENITIWTVSFELPLNAHTLGCASDPSRAFEADDADELTAAFERIATSIAELRLVE